MDEGSNGAGGGQIRPRRKGLAAPVIELVQIAPLQLLELMSKGELPPAKFLHWMQHHSIPPLFQDSQVWWPNW